MSKILIIEDDLALTGYLTDFFEAKRHVIDHAADGVSGLALLEHGQYAAAIVDWDLPGMSGIEICQQYRKKGGTTPIIMLTAKNTTPELVNGFEAGADDYLTKPFQMEELDVRIKSLLKRQPGLSTRQLQLGDLQLDLDLGLIRIKQSVTQLTRKEMGILELFMRNPERLFTAEALLEHVWSTDSESGTETVRTHINRLRKRLSSASPGAGDSIESVYGLGYRMKRPGQPD